MTQRRNRTSVVSFLAELGRSLEEACDEDKSPWEFVGMRLLQENREGSRFS